MSQYCKYLHNLKSCCYLSLVWIISLKTPLRIHRPRQTMHPHNSPHRHIACNEKLRATAHIAGNRPDSAAQQGAGLPKQGQREKPQTNRIYTSFRHKKNTTLPRRCRPYAYALPSRPCNLLKERQQKRGCIKIPAHPFFISKQ